MLACLELVLAPSSYVSLSPEVAEAAKTSLVQHLSGHDWVRVLVEALEKLIAASVSFQSGPEGHISLIAATAKEASAHRFGDPPDPRAAIARPPRIGFRPAPATRKRAAGTARTAELPAIAQRHAPLSRPTALRCFTAPCGAAARYPRYRPDGL